MTANLNLTAGGRSERLAYRRKQQAVSCRVSHDLSIRICITSHLKAVYTVSVRWTPQESCYSGFPFICLFHISVKLNLTYLVSFEFWTSAWIETRLMCVWTLLVCETLRWINGHTDWFNTGSFYTEIALAVFLENVNITWWKKQCNFFRSIFELSHHVTTSASYKYVSNWPLIQVCDWLHCQRKGETTTPTSSSFAPFLQNSEAE